MSSGGGGAGSGSGGAAAAAAGPAGGADAGQQQGQQGQQVGGGEAQGGFDPAALSQTLAGLQGDQQALRDALTQLAGAQQPDGQEDGQPLDGDGFDDDSLGLADGESDDEWADDGESFDGGFDGEPGDVAEAIASSTDQYVQAAMAPLANELSQTREQMSEMDTRAKIGDLISGRPELGDPSVGKQVVEAAHAFADANGVPELGSQPWLWGLVYDAMKGHEYAAEEEGREYADPEAAHLEGGGGAAPMGLPPDAGDRILNAHRSGGRKGGSALPFGA